MEQEQLSYFKDLLEQKKLDLLKQLDDIGTKTPRKPGVEINFDADFPDYGNSNSIEDNASEVIDYTTNLSIETQLEGDLRDVEKSLQKMADGTYGRCKYCKQEIEVERLKIRPESTSCVSCKKTLKNLA